MGNYKDMKALVVAYDSEWSTVSAMLELGGPYPKALTIKVPIDEFEKLKRYPIKNRMNGRTVLAEETEVIFKNVKYTGANTNGSVWTYSAEAIELIH